MEESLKVFGEAFIFSGYLKIKNQEKIPWFY